ncbi:MAG: dihydrofolate reductase [Bacteroidota bacterium]
MIKTIVVAISDNGVIGKDNDLVWHMPADLKWFKQQTSGHHVIMGRKSFESLNKKPLPNRTHIIITRKEDYEVPDGVYVVNSLDEAYKIGEGKGLNEIIILGGGEIYKQSLPDIDKMIITEIKEAFDGDTHFPKIDFSEWIEVFREDHKADERNPHDYSFVIYDRKPN